MSDTFGDGYDDSSGTGWTPECDVCTLLYSIKATVEGNQNRLQQIQSYLNTLAPLFTANFDTNFPWDYQIKEKCSDDTFKSYQGTGKGIPALVAMHRDLALMLKDSQRSSCENDNFAVVPEWWQLRPEADRPQLIVQCAEKNADDSLGSAKYVVTIPHYQHTIPYNLPPFSNLEKGSYQGVLTLKDNSKVIIYGKTIQETRNVLYNIYSEIDTNYRNGFYPKVGPIGNPNFKEITVYPKYGKYFATGVAKTVPTWTVAY
jgi:hypothetical protein